MEIPLEAKAQCADGEAGHSTAVIIDPMKFQISHLVVKESAFPFIERIVPLEQVAESSADLILLRCRLAELAEMETLVEYDYLPECEPGSTHLADEYWTWPYLLPEESLIPLEHERIPTGEVSVHRGARVVRPDRRASRVKGFLIDADGLITGLSVREGHLWEHRDVTIPVSQVDRFTEQVVYLKPEMSALASRA
jgi:hypothetical protein